VPAGSRAGARVQPPEPSARAKRHDAAMRNARGAMKVKLKLTTTPTRR